MTDVNGPGQEAVAPTGWAARASSWLRDDAGDWVRREASALLAVAVLLGIVAVSGSYVFWDSWHGTDGGDIFVHGPQVYTRERLVNDRYQEDSWLNSMLEKSPNEAFGYAASRAFDAATRRGLDANIGGSPDGGATAPGGGQATTRPAPVAMPAMPEISAQPTFKLQATRAYREQIRTMLIENQLDDRHDLHGNTLYRLRFDASILPKEGSHAAARIEITIHPPASSDVSVDGIEQGRLTPAEFGRWLGSWRDLYVRWRTSLELRLEEEAAARARAYDNGRFSPDDYELLFSTLREGVLALAGQIEQGPVFPPGVKLDDAVRQCVLGKFATARRELEKVKADLPSRDKAEPDSENPMVKEFRQYFLRGEPASTGAEDRKPIEWHPAHDMLRARIDRLLQVRQTLTNATGMEFCQPPSITTGLAPLPGVTPAPTVDGPTAPLFGVTQLRRRLLDSVFWPRIYKAVTGVEDVVFNMEGPIPFRGRPVLPVTPPSLSKLAVVEWEPERARRTFRVPDLTLPITVATLPSCFETGAAVEPVLVGETGKLLKDSQVTTLFVRRREFAELVDKAPQLKMHLLLAGAKERLDRQKAEFQQRAQKVPDKLSTEGTAQAVRKPGEQPKPRPATDKPEQQAEEECAYYSSVEEKIPLGLFSFALRLSQAKEVYTYAISPTEPDELIANRIRQEWADDLSLQAKIGSLLQAGTPADAKLKLQDETAKNQRYDTMQRSVFGYGERVKTDSGNARAKIGWQVMPRDRPASAGSSDRLQLGPKQIPMTALVSLPAWWEHITLEVKRSWVDRHGRAVEVHDEQKLLPKYEIELPTNFETLDASLFASADSGPVIIDWQVPRQAVRPCLPFSITLIGRRLWRSTVVTLGGERANRVIVTPNMNGIIATFDALPRRGTERSYAPLTVWTSQGNAQLPRLVEVEGTAATEGCPKPGDQAAATGR